MCCAVLQDKSLPNRTFPFLGNNTIWGKRWGHGMTLDLKVGLRIGQMLVSGGEGEGGLAARCGGDRRTWARLSGEAKLGCAVEHSSRQYVYSVLVPTYKVLTIRSRWQVPAARLLLGELLKFYCFSAGCSSRVQMHAGTGLGDGYGKEPDGRADDKRTPCLRQSVIGGPRTISAKGWDISDFHVAYDGATEI
jgi:hypothetical protein